ncbi:MAG: recombinase family protein [Frankiaceae bacterium]
MVRAAALYARISSDQEGSGLGVARQLEDCRRLADSLGWTVAEEYVDNDLSAYSGKRRPAYERMLADLAEGRRDAVVVYHIDRLTRRPIELEQFVAIVDAARVRHVRFVVGDLDIGNGDGLLMARILAAMAANESATKSRRVRRKLEQVAAQGRPHGGSLRPFGYDDDRITIRHDEAEVIRQLAARFIAGESLRSLATWLDEQGIKTVAGGTWRTPTLRTMLASPRIAGLRQHRGQVVGKAAWEPIISEQDHERVLTRLDQQAASGRCAPRRYLLTGLLRCGRCGNRLYSSAREATRRYVCSAGPDHGGCGRLSVIAAPVEDLIAKAVLYRLDTPDLARALAGRAAGDAEVAALAEQLTTDRAQLDELAEAYGTKQITMRDWLTAKKPIEDRIADRERRLRRATDTTALEGLPGTGAELGERWAGLNLTRQHAIVAAILDHAVIGPGRPGAKGLDASRVQPVWRL